MRKNSQISSMVKLSLKSSVCKCRDYRVLSLLCSQIHYDLGSIVFRKHMSCFGHIESHRSTCILGTSVHSRTWKIILVLSVFSRGSWVVMLCTHFFSRKHMSSFGYIGCHRSTCILGSSVHSSTWKLPRFLGFQLKFVRSHVLYAKPEH